MLSEKYSYKHRCAHASSCDLPINNYTILYYDILRLHTLHNGSNENATESSMKGDAQVTVK